MAHVSEHDGGHVDPAAAVREALHLLLVWRRVESPSDQQRYRECDAECNAARGVAALTLSGEPPSHDTIPGHVVALVVPATRPLSVALRSHEHLSPYTRVQAPLLL